MSTFNDNEPQSAELPFDDELDRRLRSWHRENRRRAETNRDRLLAALDDRDVVAARRVDGASRPFSSPTTVSRRGRWRGFGRLAASIALLATLGVVLLPTVTNTGAFANIVPVSNGGALEAFDPHGVLLGPCPLQHTDVDVEISGRFTRVTVQQRFRNPYPRPIEAVYTFPLGHRAAVDRMRIVIDDERIVEGEVKERAQARRIYESARDAGHVAALLEQERPNIFTQSVANIEPGAQVEVEISYVETVRQRDGEFIFSFPMTVAPRYIPGYPRQGRAGLPAELRGRHGVILRGPAVVEEVEMIDDRPEGQRDQPRFGAIVTRPVGPAPHLLHLLERSTPIERPDATWWGDQPATWNDVEAMFNVTYADGTGELGMLYDSGVGALGQRWFYIGHHAGRAPRPDTGFSPDTDQVPDASRITPMPTRPPTRAGHDVSLRVSIDTGGPAITLVESELHEIESRAGDVRFGKLKPSDNIRMLKLADQRTIPNRDFVLKWRVADDAIEEATFVHADPVRFPDKPGFFTLVLEPPARVEPAEIRPRELIFVLDTSGSMKGEPIAKAKSVLSRALLTMRPKDTFNVITFAGSTDILWAEPRPHTDANVAEALAWVNSRQGSGGTEMMTAIEAALNPAAHSGDSDLVHTVEELANLPADGRRVRVLVPSDDLRPLQALEVGPGLLSMRFDGDRSLTAEAGDAAARDLVAAGAEGPERWIITGRWTTKDAERRFVIDSVSPAAPSNQPMRIAMFLTDGEVGNDIAIIDAVRRHARTTRVFSFGIGNSVNRYLLEGIAQAARGAVEFVTQMSEADAAVERFVERIEAPILTDIEVDFSEGLDVSDILPRTPGGLIPDLYDRRPIIIHGRYARAGEGSLTIRGRTADGPYQRTIGLTFPEHADDHDVIATLWARQMIEEITGEDLAGVQRGAPREDVRERIVELGEQFQVMSQYTSFVAVEKARVTVAGRPMLVTVPIELPSDADWSGYFGPDGCIREDAVRRRLDAALPRERFIDQLLRRAEGLKGVLGATLGDADDAVNARLRRVRELQLQRDYDEAMKVVDEILFLDEGNPVALALRDALQTAALYESFTADDREREFSYSWTFQQNREAAIAPPTTPSTNSADEAIFSFSADFPWQRAAGDDDLRNRVADVEAKLGELQRASAGGEWLTPQRAAELRVLVSDTLSDASTRSTMFFDGQQIQARRADDAAARYGIGAKSTTGIMVYPEDWPQLSNRQGFENRRVVLHHSDAAGVADRIGDSFAGTILPPAETTAPGALLPGNDSILLGDTPLLGPLFEFDDAPALDLHTELSSGDAPAGTHTESLDSPEESSAASESRETSEGEGSHQIDRLADVILEIESQRTAGAPESDDEVAADAARRPPLGMLLGDASPNRRVEVAALVGKLYQAGHQDAAETLARWLAELDPDWQVARSIVAVLEDAAFDEEKKISRLTELAATARSELIERIAAEIRSATLARRVEADLLSHATEARATDGANTPGKEPALISLRLASVDGDVLDRLRSAGLHVEDVAAEARVVVGRAAMRQIVDVALVPEVRRVERAQVMRDRRP